MYPVTKLLQNKKTKKENLMVNEYRGYSLFNDIDDASLRSRNRAVTLCNIAEAHTNNEKRISPGGAALMIRYTEQIPEDERKTVLEQMVVFMKERCYDLA